MVFKANYPDVEIPEDSTITQFTFKGFADIADKNAFIDVSGRKVTYGQILALTNKFSVGLHEKGFKKGDTFCIYSPNVPEYVIAFHGVAQLGGIVTTANPLYTAGELAHQLEISNSSYLLTIPMFLDKAKEAAEKQGKIKEIFVFGEAEGASPFASLLTSDKELPKVDIDPKNDIVVLPFSSGTTGLPKGVMLTHYNLVANLKQVELLESDVGPDDVFVGVLPYFHIYGMIVVMSFGLIRGVTVVNFPKFDLPEFLQAIQDYKVTRAHIVPPIILALAKHPLVDKYDVSSLQYIFSGAAPLGGDLSKACSTRLNCSIKQGYGMTELSPVSHINPSGAVVDGSIGVLIPNLLCKIVDVETGKEIEATGEENTGEIWLAGPNVMKGYLNLPEETASTIDKDNYLHTGDIGYVDDAGYYYIVDRLKELIKYKGYQVPPAELEALLLSHDSIADAAVIGIPDEEAGELPRAYVVLKADVKLTVEEINTFVDAKVAPYKKLRGGIHFIDAIPKSASGKILRRNLKEKALAELAK